MAELTTPEFMELLQQKQVRIGAREGNLTISAPVGAIDPKLKSELMRRKEVLLLALTQRDAGRSIPRLSEAERSGRLALTPAQQGMWLVEHFNTGSAAYNIPEAFRLDTSVDLDMFQTAVNHLLARHEVLRCSFHEEDGELYQCINTQAAACVEFTDLSGLTEAKSAARCSEVIREEAGRPFRLAAAPLVRFHLFRLAAEKHTIFLNIHHIIADRITLYVLREELTLICRAIAQNKEIQLKDLYIQYVDYAVWLSGQLRSSAITQQLTYWKTKLIDPHEPVNLSHSLSRPEKRTSRGATQLLTISESEYSAIAALGVEEAASPFMVFLALFALLIASASKATDFCIGSPATQRKYPGTERMVGLFLNMLAFRCIVKPGTSFRNLLRQIRSTALEAYENSDVPFQSVVKALKLNRRSQRSPVFQIMFGYETYLPSVAGACQIDSNHGTARYDLSLQLSETAAKGIEGFFEYSTDLFLDSDIRLLAEKYQALIQAVISNPAAVLVKS